MPAIKYILAALLAAIYVYFGYFLDRSDFTSLVVLFGSAFVFYFYIAFTTNDVKETDILLWFSMAFRLIFILAIPCLSDDFYRFLWDGKLFINGYNPYLFIPSEIVDSSIAEMAGLTQEMYANLNSPQYYSVYPPINQLLFSLGGFFERYGMLAGVIALRVPILVAEFFMLKYIKRLLEVLKMNPSNVLWYALNPLVIIELSGNLHYEGMMMMCIVVAIYWLVQHKWAGAAVWWAMAISIKLIPVLFLPILLPRLGILKGIWFYLITGLTLLFTFLPFLDEQLIYHIASSIDLYFRTFEFNASIYYIIRWLGFKSVGYNIIQTAGPVLSVVTFLMIMSISFYKNDSWLIMLKKMLFAYSVYLLLASTVHPWYVINLVALSVFVTRYRYALLWASLIILSYVAYQTETYQENYLLIWVEYLLVLGWFLFELLERRVN